MKRPPSLVLALLTPFVLGWSAVSYATGNCQNGKTLYNKSTAATNGLSCSNASCHGAGVNLHSIQNAAGNPSLIDQALDNAPPGGPDMVATNLRVNLPLNSSDIDDLATYIFYATIPQACPAVAPSVSASPSSASFGNVNVGSTSATQIITVFNTGAGNATGLSYANSNAAEFPVVKTCGASIAAGANCAITVSYKPSAAGADSATYTITGTGGINIPITLSGNGVVPGPNVSASPASASFGSVTVGSTSSGQTITISNTGTAAATGMTYAAPPTHFGSASTCTATLNAGATCTITFTFSPTAAGTFTPNYTITGTGINLAIALSGTGVAAGVASLQGSPPVLSFGNVTVGQTSAAVALTITNSGGAAASGIAFSNSNPSEFLVSGSTCGVTLNAGGSCALNVAYMPSAPGADSATLTINYGSGAALPISLSGTGVTGSPPPPATATAIEYYHQAFDHYFITAIADEITKLDNGTFVGWARTGKSFKVYTSTASGLNPVCRFFSTAFAPKSSHFYTPLPAECTVVKANPNWMFEDEVFFIAVPTVDGTCPAGTSPVYRVYNNGQGAAPNHRYTTDLAVRTAMLALGWIPEGYGPIGVIMCAPP